MDCAPIVTSGWSSGSASMSIEAVALVLGCLARLVGTVSGGDAGLAALDGLGTDCALPVCGGAVSLLDAVDGITLIVFPVPIVTTPLRWAGCGSSGSIVKPSGRPAIVASD
eukprot:4812091-Amphidinium_carterae.1